MVLEIQIKGCNDCPFKGKEQDMGAILTSCNNPWAPRGYGSILDADRSGDVRTTPPWCPVKKHEGTLVKMKLQEGIKRNERSKFNA